MYKFIFVINSTNYVVEALYKHKTVPGRVLLQLQVFSAPYSSVIFTVKLTFFLGGGRGDGVSNSSGEVINRDYEYWLQQKAKLSETITKQTLTAPKLRRKCEIENPLTKCLHQSASHCLGKARNLPRGFTNSKCPLLTFGGICHVSHSWNLILKA